jgi:hypothetical protein
MAGSRDGLLGGWRLFSWAAISMCLAVVLRMRVLDLSDPDEISAMIRFSVRLSVPWLYLAFAAWGTRTVAWGRKRMRAIARGGGDGTKLPLVLNLGLILGTAGLAGLGPGSVWAPKAWSLIEVLGPPALLFELSVPFLAIFLIAFGDALAVRSARSTIEV